MVLISDQLGEPNGSSKCRHRGSGLHMVISPRAREASVQISLQFDRSRTVDSAAQDVQAAINATAGQGCDGPGSLDSFRGGIS
jgi:hypothetical protein